MSMMYILNLVDLHLKYYTDFHDIDEDNTTNVSCGGYWGFGSREGITRRYMFDSVIADIAASKYNKNSTPLLRVEF